MVFSLHNGSRRRLLRQGLPACALLVIQGARALQGEAHIAAHESTPPSPTPTDLLMQAHALLRHLHGAQLATFLDQWPQTQVLRSGRPSTVPVLRWLPSVRKFAPEFSRSFIDTLVSLTASLTWQRSYSPALVGASFYDNYGWTELSGLTGPTPSEHLACGLLLLGPGVFYPPHRHEADEIYVPLSGTAEWKRGDDAWRERPPGSVIHHGSFESHAMRTGAVPMLALYLWRSANLAQKALIDTPLSDAPSHAP